MKKCSFVQEDFVYFGFVISANGLKVDLEKVKANLEWPIPENVGEVRSFHGLASFYRKFIGNFSVVGNDMTTTMIGDKRDFKWTHVADKSFEALKHKVAELPILALLDFNKVFQVECDANSNAIGAILVNKVNFFLSLVKS